MTRVTRSRRAEQDLLAIAEYISADNPTAAARWLDEIERNFTLLASYAGIGEEVSEIRPGLRRFCHGQYLIYFEPLDDELRIVRVLHGARRMEDLSEF
ncbi:MAG: type II toxin-antitoxin system RelE/ParE family toxin [Pirellulales bacterium]